MTVTEYARRDGVNPITARMKARAAGVGTWNEGTRDLSETEWQIVKKSIHPGRGRPKEKTSQKRLV